MVDVLFDHQITFIYVKDLDQSKVFYEDILRFPLILDQGKCRIVKTTHGNQGFLGYCLQKNSESKSHGIIFTLITSSVNKWYLYLQSKAVEILEPPKINPEFNIYHFFLLDPDGYKIEIQQFLGPAWEQGLSKVRN